MGKQKKKIEFSINKKLYILISLLVFAITSITMLWTSGYYLRLLGTVFFQKTDQVATANTEAFEDMDLSESREFMLSEETRNARREAEAKKNNVLYSEYLRENDPNGFIRRVWDHLGVVEDTYDVTDVFVAACNGACYFLGSGRDNLMEQGKQLPFDVTEETFDGVAYTLRNRDKDPAGPDIAVMKDREYSLSAAKIEGYEGDWTYWIVCEANTESLRDRIGDFFRNMMLVFVVLSTITAFIGVYILRRQITSPIIRIQHAAEQFTSENSKTKNAEPVRVDIKSRDELGSLSDSLYELECSVVKTQKELAKESEDKGRLSAQLLIAENIQKGVLPEDFPEDRDYEIYALMDPAREVGGDLYDFFETDENHLVMVIGDVSDKGIPAALFMMTSKTLLKTYMQLEPDPAMVLEKVNNILCNTNRADMFVTVWIGILDLTTGVLTAANAGHEFPMFRFGNGNYQVFRDPHGMALACLPNMKYKNYEVVLKPEDRIFVYSDGATDAINADDVQIGLDRLTKLVQATDRNAAIKDAVNQVKDNLDKWSEDAYQFDDITILSVRYKGASAKKESNQSARTEKSETATEQTSASESK